jgi:hypothetical protein
VENLVEKYNRAEREGRSTVPNRAIEAFGLEVFGTLGYPFRVYDESELWRYHDVMHEGRFEENLKLTKRFTDHEFELIAKTAKQIFGFSERYFPIRNTGKHALTASLYQFQLIMANRPHDGPLKILEIGPGCGYLGLLLTNDGHQYFAMDAAQAFYLYQKKLWSDIYGDGYFDYSESNSMTESAKVVHIPWWRFANLSIPLPEVDIVTINHALAEMHENAVKTIFARLYEMWGDNEKKLVIGENLGNDIFNRKDKIFSIIRTFGFFYSKNGDAHLWRPNVSKARPELIISPKRAKNLVFLKKFFRNVVTAILKNSRFAQIAKIFRHEPEKFKIPTTSLTARKQNLRDFFENFNPNEKSPDEKFLTQIDQSKF